MDISNASSEVDKLRLRLQSADLPANLREKAIHQIDRIALTLKYGGNLSQIDITAKFIDWITMLPWNKKTEDILDIQIAGAYGMSMASHYQFRDLPTEVLVDGENIQVIRRRESFEERIKIFDIE